MFHILGNIAIVAGLIVAIVSLICAVLLWFFCVLVLKKNEEEIQDNFFNPHEDKNYHN